MDYTRVVNKLIRQGIKLIAVDFDKTLIKLHTHGFWHKGSEELARHVRPCFQHFLLTAINSEIHVAIVTFSTQIELIEGVLKLSFPSDTVDKILIRGGNTPPGPDNEGKRKPVVTENCTCEHAFPSYLYTHGIGISKSFRFSIQCLI